MVTIPLIGWTAPAWAWLTGIIALLLIAGAIVARMLEGISRGADARRFGAELERSWAPALEPLPVADDTLGINALWPVIAASMAVDAEEIDAWLAAGCPADDEPGIFKLLARK